jgi:D-3-phosphoglycerate dehydrogenase
MKIKSQLFIATSSFSELSADYLKKFDKKNIKVRLNPLKKKLSSSQLINFANKSKYIIAGTELYSKLTIEKLVYLKHLFRLGSGIDNIDLNYIKKKKIKFSKSKITPEIAVAELIVGYTLSIYRNLIDHDKDLKRKIWKKKMGSVLNGKTVGIIGYGKVGKYLHKIIKNFGVKILINEKNKIRQKNTNLNTLLKKSDIISINVNLRSKKKLLNKAKLKNCKKGCLIINTSRPEVIDYKELYNMLKNKRIRAAGLDVFDQEPYYGKLINLDNVVLTPHIGSYSKEIRSKMEKEALDRIIKYS